MSAASLEEEVRRVGATEQQPVGEQDQIPFSPNQQRRLERRRREELRRTGPRRTTRSFGDVLAEMSWR